MAVRQPIIYVTGDSASLGSQLQFQSPTRPPPALIAAWLRCHGDGRPAFHPGILWLIPRMCSSSTCRRLGRVWRKRRLSSLSMNDRKLLTSELGSRAEFICLHPASHFWLLLIRETYFSRHSEPPFLHI